MSDKWLVHSLLGYREYMAYPDDIPPIWIAVPPGSVDRTTMQMWGLGQRELFLPAGSAICATHREAMNYATNGAPYRPVADIYPEWCGLPKGTT